MCTKLQIHKRNHGGVASEASGSILLREVETQLELERSLLKLQGDSSDQRITVHLQMRCKAVSLLQIFIRSRLKFWSYNDNLPRCKIWQLVAAAVVPEL
jgi:hypothetical protein